jgi:MYXO-CTERM domain-containing protein
MNKLLGILAVLALSTSLSFAQGSDQPSTASDANAAQTRNAARTDNAPARGDNHDWGWIGLIGLAGLAGLRGRHRQNENANERDRDTPNLRRVA